MGLDSVAILSKTPREFSIMMAAQVERGYDDQERLASSAMMIRHANNAKKVRMKDLFERPSDAKKEIAKADVMRKKADEQLAWLSQFEEFSSIA